MRVLITWIGFSDLRAAAHDQVQDAPGPVLRLLLAERFDEVHLLNDVSAKELSPEDVAPNEYCDWLAKSVGIERATISLHNAANNCHNDYAKAYSFTRDRLEHIYTVKPSAQFALLLSPGTPAAQVAMILMAQTLFYPEPEMFATYDPRRRAGRGIERVELPFALSVDVTYPLFLRRRKEDVAIPLHEAFDSILGESEAILRAKQMAQKVAQYSQVGVLLLGESGTGKELFARAIHTASPRAKRSFQVVNCAALPETLIESELFGHVKGAFTGADSDREGAVQAADGGTLFLDEIGELPPSLQPKFLRFLQEHEYRKVGENQPRNADVRVVAATNAKLKDQVIEGSFRRDLYHRLHVVPISLPPLRERKRDIKVLAKEALRRFNGQSDSPKTLSEEAIRLLERFPWHGNVRELQNSVVALAVYAPGDEITAEHVGQWLGPPPAQPGTPLSTMEPQDFFTHFVAVIDELLARFRTSGMLPFTLSEGQNLFDELLHPLVLGRLLHASGGNRSKASLLCGRKVDTSKGADKARCETYNEQLCPWIDETDVLLQRSDSKTTF